MRRILFVSCNYASDYGPMVWGTYIRMRMLLEAAVLVADRVDLLLFAADDVVVDPGRTARSLKAHWNIDVDVHVSSRSTAAHGGPLATLRGLFDLRYQRDYGDAGARAQADAVAALIGSKTELVVAHRLDAALAALAGAGGRVPVTVNFDDIEHLAKRRRVELENISLRSLARRIELGAIERAERSILAAASCALVCSPEEQAYLHRDSPAAPIDVIRNAIRFPDERSRRDQVRPTIMFIGSYGYEPNLLAAEELITKIFPIVIAKVPEARLLVAGARGERLPSAAVSHPAVTILGFIDDVATIYRQAHVACCAIRAGGGTRIKIIEAAAWKIPTVSTALGAEGLALEDGVEIVIAESPQMLADACVALLKQPDRAHAIGAAAYLKASMHYENGRVVADTADSYQRTVDLFAADRKRMAARRPS